MTWPFPSQWQDTVTHLQAGVVLHHLHIYTSSLHASRYMLVRPLGYRVS
jgi:hypothetical protein